MAKKKRITRKQLLKEPDEFLTFSVKAIQFATKNRKPLLGIAIAVVVIVVAVTGFGYFSRQSERKAFALLEAARLSHLTEALTGGRPSAPEETARKLEEVIRDFPSTHAARFSLFVLADLDHEQGRYDKAIERYERASEVFKDEKVMQAMIWNGLGHAYEAKGDYRSAAEYFRRITEIPGAFMKADAYYSLGRMMEAVDDRKGALEAYKNVLEAEKGSTAFPVAEEKVSHLKAALRVSE